MPLTSIAHSTGTEATGISASTQDTLAETTSSSDALTSTPYTEADTAGTGTEEEAGTADVLMADHILMADQEWERETDSTVETTDEDRVSAT